MVGPLRFGNACGPTHMVGICDTNVKGDSFLHARKARLSVQVLAERVHKFFFLATIHRGSDPAKLLNNILHFAHSSRAYVERGFGAVQSINDKVRNCSADVHLCLFYETQKLRINVAKGWMGH